MRTLETNLRGRWAGLILLLSLGLYAGGCGGDSGSIFVDGIEGTRSKQLAKILAGHGPAVALPAYEEFADATRELGSRGAAYCASRSPEDLDSLEQAWRDAMAAWMRAKVVTFGPAQEENRSLRIQFWPDPSANVPRAVEQILARDAELSATTLATAPAPVQGLGALEYVLFDPTARERLVDPSSGERSCRLVLAIAGNLETIAREIVTAWSPAPGGGGYSDSLAEAGPDDPLFPTRRAAIEEIVGALLTGAQTAESRLTDPLPGDAGGPRPARAESYRSRTTRDNVLHSLEGLQTMYLGGAHGIDYGFDDLLRHSGQEDLHWRIRESFRASMSGVGEIESSLEDAVQSPQGLAAVTLAIDEIAKLHRVLDEDLATATGAIVGFNGFDGD